MSASPHGRPRDGELGLDAPAGGAPRAGAHAHGRSTSFTLTAGVVVAAACFVVALGAEVVGVEQNAGDMTDIAAVVEGVAAFSPWAWAAVGTYVVVLTPALGLLVTAWEYAAVSDRRTVLLAIVVLAVLGVSAAVSILRG